MKLMNQRIAFLITIIIKAHISRLLVALLIQLNNNIVEIDSLLLEIQNFKINVLVFLICYFLQVILVFEP